MHGADGVVCEAEFRAADEPRAVVVLCHPHPQFGGSMRSVVISPLFDALPALGYSCLRFNFRGVERSTGVYGEGLTEPIDVVAALDDAAPDAVGLPLVLVGFSFGADMALSVADARVTAWVGIAPPLRFASAFAIAHDPRRKHLILAAHDEFRAAEAVAREVASWDNTTTVVVPGASHFFVGRTDRVIDEVDALLKAL